MKPTLVSLGCMAMLASATPILSDPASTLPDKGDRALDRRAALAADSKDTASINALEKRRGNDRDMNIPRLAGSVVKSLGVVVVKAIVDAAGEVLFEITNNGPLPYLVSFREKDSEIDFADPIVAGRHTISYDPLGGVKPGAVIALRAQIRP